MSSKIGLFYGTQTGNTETVAEMICEAFGADQIEMVDIAQAQASDLAEFDALIIGCPTWNIGELQSDWEGFFPELDDIDFSGKQVAYFGPGDQVGYADNFMDAIGILEAKITERGGQTVGYWPTEGYDFSESKAVREGKFVGLAIDEDNQSELTQERVTTWVNQLKQAFQR